MLLLMNIEYAWLNCQREVKAYSRVVGKFNKKKIVSYILESTMSDFKSDSNINFHV